MIREHVTGYMNEDRTALISSTDESLLRLYRYWSGRRGRASFPSSADIDLADFAYAQSHVSIIEVQRDPVRFRYRHVSTALTAHLGYEMTGRSVEEIPEPSMRAFTRRFYEQAVQRRAPLHDVNTVLIERYSWSYEVLILPFAADGETIDTLLIYRRTEPPTAASFALTAE